MSDIVEQCAAVWDRKALEAELAQASAKIVEQAAEIERLRAALQEIADHTTNPEGSGPAYSMVGNLVRMARAALKEEGE